MENNDLLQFGWFRSHSGIQLPWKLNLDCLTDSTLEALAKLLQSKFVFSEVFAVPSDEHLPRTPAGPRLVCIIKRLCTFDERYPPLIVDDVLTTGKSMEDFREVVMRNRSGIPIGFVIVARGQVPNWVWPFLTVNEWSQSRGTGLG